MREMWPLKSKKEKLEEMVEKREETLAKLKDEAEVYKKLNEQETEYAQLTQQKKAYEEARKSQREEKLRKAVKTANKVLDIIAPIQEKKREKAIKKKKEAYA